MAIFTDLGTINQPMPTQELDNLWLTYNKMRAKIQQGTGSYDEKQAKLAELGSWGDFYSKGGATSSPASAAAPTSPAPTTPDSSASVSGGVTGGTSEDSSGGSWVTGSIFKTGAGTVGSTIDPKDVQSQMLAMFQQLTGTAQSQLLKDMTGYQQSEGKQLADNYLRETFTEGLSTRMVDQFAGRLRTAQSSRGLAFGGASQQEEAALLTGLQEQQRAALLPELIKKSQWETAAPSEIYKSYMASGAAGIQGAASYGGVLASMFNPNAKTSTTDLLSQLFGTTTSYYGTGVA